MAHKFTVLDTSGAVITYDDYDKIPKDTIMALISFLPDISPSGTRGDGEELGHEIVESGFEYIPTTTKELDDQQTKDIEKLIEKLEEDDDVQNVYTTMR